MGAVCPGLKLRANLWGSMYGVGVRGVLNDMTKHLTGVPPVSSPARALDPRTEKCVSPLSTSIALASRGHTTFAFLVTLP